MRPAACSFCLSFGILGTLSIGAGGRVERCRKKHPPSVPLIYTWRSQVRIWKSAPYWSSAFNIHEALSRRRRFEHSGPYTPDQFSLISIGFFPQSIDVAPPTKTCSQGHLEHMSGVRSWWVLPVPVCALESPQSGETGCLGSICSSLGLCGSGCLLNPFTHKAVLPSGCNPWEARGAWATANTCRLIFPKAENATIFKSL